MADHADPDDAPQRVVVLHAELPPEVLRRQEFVPCDGTDYEAVERRLAEQVALVMRQLDDGEAAIMVDPETETIDIVAGVRDSRRRIASRLASARRPKTAPVGSRAVARVRRSAPA